MMADLKKDKGAKIIFFLKQYTFIDKKKVFWKIYYMTNLKKKFVKSTWNYSRSDWFLYWGYLTKMYLKTKY